MCKILKVTLIANKNILTYQKLNQKIGRKTSIPALVFSSKSLVSLLWNVAGEVIGGVTEEAVVGSTETEIRRYHFIEQRFCLLYTSPSPRDS